MRMSLFHSIIFFFHVTSDFGVGDSLVSVVTYIFSLIRSLCQQRHEAQLILVSDTLVISSETAFRELDTCT